jgi:membrane protease YdiL (CAAX protease family)
MSKHLSIYSTNILFLVVLCLQAANLLLLGMPQFVRMILNEALFVLLPALIYLRLARLPFRETVRLRWPGWTIALASLVVGAGLYPLAAISTAVYQNLLGYRIFETERLLPHTAFEGVLAIVAYAVMAPLCEEVLARGVVQRTYEGLGPRRAILFAGGLFVVFHLSLLQGLGIIPLALALGYVYWRSESLVASILTHFGANALAALVLTSGIFWKDAGSILLSMPALLIGIIVAVVALWWLKRATDPALTEALPSGNRRLWRAWPLLLAGLLYSGVVSVEFVGARFPERVLAPVTVDVAPWNAPVEWSYEIRNIIDDPVGDAQCDLTPDADTIALYCRSEQQAYDVDTGHGRYIGGDAEMILEAHWRRADGMPLQGESQAQFSQGSYRTQWTFDGVQFSVIQQDPDAPEKLFELPFQRAGKATPFVMAESTWPWVLSSLPFAEDYAASVYLFRPYTWREATQDSGPQTQLFLLTVTSIEEVATPAGTFTAWKVQVGEREIAWYAVDAPHILVQYFNGTEMWLLKDF